MSRNMASMMVTMGFKAEDSDPVYGTNLCPQPRSIAIKGFFISDLRSHSLA
jgi:hypothetical protein